MRGDETRTPVGSQPLVPPDAGVPDAGVPDAGVPDASAPDGWAIDGRAIGTRGAATRRKLLDATADLLRDNGVRDLRVVDIARTVGTSPATYYQYFRDVEDAVLVLAEEIGTNEVVPIAAVFDEIWSGDEGLANARALVEAFFELWDRHHAVLRTRNLAAQEGDTRFREIRNRANRPFVEGFAQQVRSHQATKAVADAISPVGAAAALIALIERMAGFHNELRGLGVDRTEVIETTARICFQTVVGTNS